MSDTFDPGLMTWVMDEEDLEHLVLAIESCTEVVMDLETTGLNEHAADARIVLASLTVPQPGDAGDPTTWVLPLYHPDSPWLGRWRQVYREVALAIKAADKPLSNANVKFDCRWTRAQVGVDLSGQIVWDTQVSSHALDENRSTKLKERAPETFGVARWDDDVDFSRVSATEVPLFELGAYAARDTYWTWRLKVEHERLMGVSHPMEPETPDEVEMARLGKLAVWCLMPTVATLTAVEQRGIYLDQDWVRAKIEAEEALTTAAFEDLSHRYAGMDPADASFAPTSLWFRAWAEKAVEAGDLVVSGLTPTGKPQWSRSILVRQARGGSEVAQTLLDYRRGTKRLEYLRSWLALVSPQSRIHTSYNVGSVVTGRLSSSVPNMQQVTAALRPAFVPEEGHVLADFDYSQIELRVAAFISRCEPMIEAFRRGDDLHMLLAQRITGKDLDQVLPEERQAGKSANFGLLYGMGAYGFREYAEDVYDVSFTIEEAHEIRRAFFDTWEGIEAWHARAIVRARNTGQVTSPIGRVRRLPGIFDGNEKVASFAERQAINSPVQGFASDLMQIASASIEGRLPGIEPVRDARIVATVHDNIVVELPADRWEEVGKQVMDRMLNLHPVLERMDCVLDVPLAVEAKVGTRWGWSDVGTL